MALLQIVPPPAPPPPPPGLPVDNNITILFMLAIIYASYILMKKKIKTSKQ